MDPCPMKSVPMTAMVIAGLDVAELEAGENAGPGLDGYGVFIVDGVGEWVGVHGEMLGGDADILVHAAGIEMSRILGWVAGETTPPG